MSANTDTAAAGTEPAQPSRPKTVQYAIYALAARGVFSILAALSLYGAKGEVRTLLANANKTKGWDNAELNHQVDSFIRSKLLFAGVLILLLAMIARFVWRGRSWARWIYLAVIVLLASDEYSLLGIVSFHHRLPGILTTLTGIFGIGSLVLLFLPASNKFFRPAGATGRPGGLFGALIQSRVNPGAPLPTGKGSATESPRASRPPVKSGDVSLAKSPAATVEKPARTGGPRGKSRQSPPKRPGTR